VSVSLVRNAGTQDRTSVDSTAESVINYELAAYP